MSFFHEHIEPWLPRKDADWAEYGFFGMVSPLLLAGVLLMLPFAGLGWCIAKLVRSLGPRAPEPKTLTEVLAQRNKNPS